MAALQFQVSFFPSGQQIEVPLGAGDSVRELRAEVERQKGGLPPATFLKLVQGNSALLDHMPVAELRQEEAVVAVLSYETRLDILLHASGKCSLYKEMLSSATRAEADSSKSTAVLGPFPTILAVLEELTKEAPQMEHLKPGPKEGWLEFYGANGDLLLPSLLATPLLDAVGSAEPLEAVTLSVEINSDAYNQGLGVVVEASPLVAVPEEFSKLPQYQYNGYGLQNEDRQRNAVKFHPGMGGGALRVEGTGGFYNTDMGFTPRAFADGFKALHRLELTFRTSGENSIRFVGAEEGQEWQKEWRSMLFDGLHVPALYAWLDLGTKTQPVRIGAITMQGHFCQAKSP